MAYVGGLVNQYGTALSEPSITSTAGYGIPKSWVLQRESMVFNATIYKLKSPITYVDCCVESSRILAVSKKHEWNSKI